MNSSRSTPLVFSLGAGLAALSLAAITSCSTVPPGYVVEELVPGSKMHGIHGLAFDAEGATAEELQAHQRRNQKINQAITMVLEQLNR